LNSRVIGGWLPPLMLVVRPQSQHTAFMKTSLLQRWAAFVYKRSLSRVWPYACLLLTIVLCVLQILCILHFTEHSHIHFLLIMLVVTLMAFERLGFSELLMGRDKEIERLRHESKASA
jgi:hypothetical protein